MAKLKVGRVLVPAGLVLSVLSGSDLAAHGAAGWLAVDLGHGAEADIRVMLLPASGGYQVFFKNFGTTTVHFSFYLQGVQTADAVPTNGRIHLKPGNPVGPLSLQPQPGAAGLIEVRAVDVAVGNADAPASSAE